MMFELDSKYFGDALKLSLMSNASDDRSETTTKNSNPRMLLRPNIPQLQPEAIDTSVRLRKVMEMAMAMAMTMMIDTLHSQHWCCRWHLPDL